MKIRQISIFLENKSGRLANVCSILGGKNINIKALYVAESSEFGVLRLIVDDPQKALELLRTNHFTAEITDVVAVEVPDQPGGLAEILIALQEEKINVEYMYGFMERRSDKALMVFRFDEIQRAIDTLLARKFSIATELQ